MKLYGLFGKGSGKLGSSVFAISSGEQIVREYNPVVENPNTPAQVEQRAKFKLLSQIAATLASIIVIAKQGLISSRNRFIGLNIGKATYADDKASINVQNIDITGGSAAMQDFEILAEAQGQTPVRLISPAASDITAVVYAVVGVDANSQLIVRNSKVVTAPGENRKFDTTLANVPQPAYIFAYGIKGDVAGALAEYGDYEAPEADVIASLIANRSTKAGTLTFTKTVCNVIE